MTDTVKTAFYLLRHGPTEWNRDKLLQGQYDSPLTEHGVQLAGEWGKALVRFGLDLILSSDLGRARATTELVNASLGLPVIEDPRLREQDWGEWAGLSIRDLRYAPVYGLNEEEAKGWDFQPPGGESRRDVLARSRAAVLDAARAHPGKKILALTHEGVIRCLVYDLAGRRYMPDEPALLKEHRLHRLDSDGEALDIRELNLEL